MPKADPVKLDPNEILVAEFEYIAQTAFQANEDRARVASFYVVSVGSFIAAILGTQFLSERFDPRITNFAFAGLFFLLTLMGTLTIVQLARLRIAWHTSAVAMNKIKEYYISNLPESKLQDAILWRETSLPPINKSNSIARLLAFQVAILSGLTFGAFVFFIIPGFFPAAMLSVVQGIPTTVLGILAYIVQMQVFTKTLKNKEKK